MHLHHLAFVILINMIWGLSFIALKYSVADLSPLLANAGRFLFVAIALLPFLKIVKGRMRQVLWVATIFGVFHFGIFIFAISLSSGVSEVAIAAQLSVPFSTLLAIVMLKEVVHVPRVLGITISFMGVLVMGLDPEIFAHIGSIICMATAALLVAYATILMRKLKDIPAMTLQAWVALMGFGGSVLLSAIFESGQVEAVKNISSPAVYGLVYSAVGSSIIGHAGVNFLLRHYEVSVVSPYMLLTPVFGVLGGVLILDETLTTRMMAGGLLTLAGVAIITLRNYIRKVKIQANTEIV